LLVISPSWFKAITQLNGSSKRDALGWPVTFIEGEGPRLRPIDNPSEVSTLRADVDLNRLSPIFETIERAKSQLPPACAMVGFCGAPWTVASYVLLK
jgi:uroporphyrinogen decarboxylase